MLILNPRSLTFGATAYPDVLLVTIDRSAKRLALEWSDRGPYVAFVDVPEQIVTVTMVQEVMEGAPDGPLPGASATLTFVSSPTGSDSASVRFTATAVVKACTHEITTSGRNIGARRTVEFVLVSATGAGDPMSFAPVEEFTGGKA